MGATFNYKNKSKTVILRKSEVSLYINWITKLNLY